MTEFARILGKNAGSLELTDRTIQVAEMRTKSRDETFLNEILWCSTSIFRRGTLMYYCHNRTYSQTMHLTRLEKKTCYTFFLFSNLKFPSLALLIGLKFSERIFWGVVLRSSSNLRRNKTGGINDPLGQTHGHASSEHCFLLFCFSRFEKWGRTDGQHVRKQWSLLAVTLGWPSGSKRFLARRKELLTIRHQNS